MHRQRRAVQGALTQAPRPAVSYSSKEDRRTQVPYTHAPHAVFFSARRFAEMTKLEIRQKRYLATDGVSEFLAYRCEVCRRTFDRGEDLHDHRGKRHPEAIKDAWFSYLDVHGEPEEIDIYTAVSKEINGDDYWYFSVSRFTACTSQPLKPAHMYSSIATPFCCAAAPGRLRALWRGSVTGQHNASVYVLQQGVLHRTL